MAEEAAKESTEPDKTLHKSERNASGLLPRQQQAADLLALGETKTKVAAAVGVSRQQLYTWEQNVFFRSAISKRHADLWQENKQRLRGLSAKAVDVIEQELESGNLKAAVELLKIVGMSNGRIALVQPGKSVEDLLEIDAAKDVDAFMADWEKPATTQEAFQREFGYRPALIKDRTKRLKAMAKVPEDEAEDDVATDEDSAK